MEDSVISALEDLEEACQERDELLTILEALIQAGEELSAVLEAELVEQKQGFETPHQA